MSVRSEATSDVLYRSHVRVGVAPGGIKLVHLPQEANPVPMGMHGAIAAHYKMTEGDFTPHASTLDYVVGATVGCMTGTLNRALQVRNIATDNGRLQVEAVGEIEIEDGVLLIRRIRVLVTLCANASDHEKAERVIDIYASKCPVYRSLHKAIDITTELDFHPLNANAL